MLQGGGGGHHHWNYAKQGGDWGSTNPLCASGNRQSPINIPSVTTTNRNTALNFDYRYSPFSQCVLENNGHTIQVGPKGCKSDSANKEDKQRGMGGVVWNGEEYSLLQFHVHIKSEHQIDQRHTEAEIHLVHQKKGAKKLDSLLVLGIMLKTGPKCSRFLDALQWSKWPNSGGRMKAKADINDLQVIKSGGDVFAYQGSLTTPPCAETVEWRVIKSFEPICAAQLATLKKLFQPHGNFRGIQPLFNRKVALCKATPVDSLVLSLQREQSIGGSLTGGPKSGDKKKKQQAKVRRSQRSTRRKRDGDLIIANRNHVVVNCGGSKCA